MEQRRREARLPLKERLLWIDDALELADRLKRARRWQGGPSGPSSQEPYGA